MTRVVRARSGASVAIIAMFGAMFGACATTRTNEIQPRYIAVHNTLSAMGLVQHGPIHQGALVEGREVRLTTELSAQCTTVVAIGGAGVRDVDLTLLDSEDKPLGHDTTKDSQAAVRVCPEKGGRFTLVVKMKEGAGDFLAASWTGGSSGPSNAAPSASAIAATSNAPGTCEAPILLAAGSTTGNTRKGEAEHAGGCGSSDSKELVYRLDVAQRQRVTIEVDPTFDSVLYVRKDDCAEKDAEVACNDDVSSTTSSSSKARNSSARGSRVDEVLDPGTYWVFVDGYNSEVGSYRLNVAIADVPSFADACQKAVRLASPTLKASGTLTGAFNHAQGSCDAGKGPDVLHRLDLPQRARARVVVHSDDFSPVVHIRKSCLDDKTEIGCTDSGMKAEDAALTGVLDPGSYTVFADSSDKAAHGRYTVEAELTSENGAGVRGDACGDALPLVLNDKATEGDTFDAKDDVAGKCSASSAPDVLYRFEVARRSRVIGRFSSEEGEHVFVLAKSCTDRTTEISCGTTIDEVLAPGTYSLAIDGSSKGPFGRYTFTLKSKDIAGQEGACRAPPPLTIGQTITGTTAGAGDRFSESCAGREDSQASSDRVFKLTLATRTHFQLLLSTPTHDGVIAIRKSCADPPQMKSLRTVEAACNNDGPDNRHSKIDTTLDPGTYFVVVDGHQGKNEGSFSLESKIVK